jgi:hypothetical protein
MDRGWVHGRFLLAAALRETGDLGGARRQARAGLSVAPDDPDLLRIAAELELTP